MGTASEHNLRLVVVTSVWRCSDQFLEMFRSIPVANVHVFVPLTFFWIMQILCFNQKIKNNLINLYNRTSSPGVKSTTFISPCVCVHHYATSVSSCWHPVEILLFKKATDYRSNFANTILFENCSCFSKIPFSISVESPRIFQCLISISAGHWIRQIDGDLPRWFCSSALFILVISMTGRSERSARALSENADVVREAVGN